MKTKNKYFIIFNVLFICILGIFYMHNLSSKNMVYKNSEVNESKLVSGNNFKKSEINILFVGDIMTDRYIRKQINKYENNSDKKVGENFVEKYLSNLKEINSNYDYVVANLEGPITENKSKSLNDDGTYGKDLIFTFPTSTTKILKLLNIKAVSLANNHTDNFYYAGYESTKKFLEISDINYFGNPYNNNLNIDKNNFEKEGLSEIMCEKDICIAYVGYHQFTKNNTPEVIGREIKRLKENNLEKNNIVDFVIVMPHWGVEYDTVSNEKQKEYARSWVDSGADLVVGAHPHVIQESEIYKNKYIYYSVGNYIFDQWFEENVKHGLGLDITFKKECENNIENICKKEIILNKELKIFIDRNGVKYML